MGFFHQLTIKVLKWPLFWVYKVVSTKTYQHKTLLFSKVKLTATNKYAVTKILVILWLGHIQDMFLILFLSTENLIPYFALVCLVYCRKSFSWNSQRSLRREQGTDKTEESNKNWGIQFVKWNCCCIYLKAKTVKNELCHSIYFNRTLIQSSYI